MQWIPIVTLGDVLVVVVLVVFVFVLMIAGAVTVGRRA